MCLWEKQPFLNCFYEMQRSCLFGDSMFPQGIRYNCVAHVGLWLATLLSCWLYNNVIKLLSSLRDKQQIEREKQTDRGRERSGKEGNYSSIKIQTAPAPLGVQTSGRGEERRRRINDERRKWNERTGDDGLVALIKVWIFTALSSPRLNTNYSQQLLNELAKTHYHNVHVYHLRNTELHC